MKMIFISEDHQHGLEADWPFIPRIGEGVSFRHRGGTNTLRVSSVEYRADGAGRLEMIEVHLTY